MSAIPAAVRKEREIIIKTRYFLYLPKNFAIFVIASGVGIVNSEISYFAQPSVTAFVA